MSTPFDRRLLWVHWEGDAVAESSIESLAANIKQATPNVAGIVLKTSNGSAWQGQHDTKAAMAVNGRHDIQEWVDKLAAVGLETHLWCVVRGNDIAREAELVVQACHVTGVKSMLLDVEGGQDYFGGKSALDARNLITRIRSGIQPDFHLGLNFDARGGHPANIHIQEWLPYVQSLHPMVYHWEFGAGEHGPEAYLNDAFGTLVRYGLPIIPMLQTYPQPSPVPEDQVFQASEYAFAKGAVGLTYFRYGGDCSAAPITTGIQRVETRREPPENNPERRVFQVRGSRLRVRDGAGTGSNTVSIVESGTMIEVDAHSRTEASGYVWWQSAQGWLAQGRIDNKQVLMVELTPDVPPHGQALLDPLPPDPEEKPPTNKPDVPDKRFQVVTNTLNVRSQPELGSEFLVEGVQLAKDTVVIVDADAWTEKNGFVWWFHGAGWSAEKSLDSRLVFLQDLTPDVLRLGTPPIVEPAPTPQPYPEPYPVPTPAPTPEPEIPRKRFRVISRSLNVRSEPGLARRAVTATLKAGEEVLIRADAWKELDGYVWWQHGSGWSAERSLDGRLRFMEDLTPEILPIDPDAPKPPVSPKPPTIVDPEPAAEYRYQVVSLGLTVRADPTTSGQRLGRLQQGTELVLSEAAANRVERDGYVWRRHAEGWSAERSLDGKHEFMLNVDKLPLLGRLIQRMPVRMSETDWVQYYGNTSFAFRFGRRNSYHKFAQGLHSGLDFGKYMRNPANPPIFTSVDGIWDGRGAKYGPNRIDVLVDRYRIIYGHIGRPATIPQRQSVAPDTVVGVVENTQIHLHFEIRYRDKYIINPLIMMPQSLVDEFTGKFPPKDTEFVQTGGWQRFLTALDQPIIRLGGEVIGPTA